MPKRAVYAVLAWGAATATAMGVVWTGLDAVLPTAAQGPHVATVAAWPVQDAASTGLGAAEATSVAPGAGATASPTATAEPSRSASPGAKPSATADPGATASGGAGTERRYSTPGGTAVLTLYPDHAALDLAIPADGYSAKSWTNTDMLEVEFAPAAGGAVYEVIATWNGTSPQVQTVTVGG